VVRQRRGGNQRGEQRGALQPPVTVARCAFVPSFMCGARPSFSLVEVDLELARELASVPGEAADELLVVAPPMSQLASSDEVMTAACHPSSARSC